MLVKGWNKEGFSFLLLSSGLDWWFGETNPWFL